MWKKTDRCGSWVLLRLWCCSSVLAAEIRAEGVAVFGDLAAADDGAAIFGFGRRADGFAFGDDLGDRRFAGGQAHEGGVEFEGRVGFLVLFHGVTLSGLTLRKHEADGFAQDSEKLTFSSDHSSNLTGIDRDKIAGRIQPKFALRPTIFTGQAVFIFA